MNSNLFLVPSYKQLKLLESLGPVETIVFFRSFQCVSKRKKESTVNTRIVAGLEISSLDSNQFVELSEVYSQKNIPVAKDNIPRQEDIDSWPHLKEVKIPAIQAEVGLLIGANVPKAMEPLQVVNNVDNGPYAVRTILGWTVNGPLRGGSDMVEANSLTGITANRISVAKLEELWQLQFKLDKTKT